MYLRPPLVKTMQLIGNRFASTIWEAKLPRRVLTPNSAPRERERFIHSKYVSKEFLADLPSRSDPLCDVSISERAFIDVSDANSVILFCSCCLMESVRMIQP